MERNTCSFGLAKLLVVLTALFITPLCVEAATGNVNVSVRHQILEGFGASNVWSGSTLKTLGDSHPEIYDVIFGDLGLDILRLRNTYEYDAGYIDRCAEVISEGRARTGRPLKIMISSWSPPPRLKSCGATTCYNGTLKKDGGGNYMYNDFAQWWYDSIVDYNSHGMHADYVNMQNEPDFSPGPPPKPEWDSCRFGPLENSTFAGYDLAFRALYTKLNSEMPNHPKLLAPEACGLASTSAPAYIIPLTTTDRSNVYGWAHHLYNGGGSGSNPDGYIPAMTSFGSDHNDKPILQTEYSLDSHVTTYLACMDLAKLMHNSLVVEGVSAYLYWQLTYTDIGLVAITSSSWTINPIYYAFKHYSAFTDPNWRRIDASTNSSDLRISAYISPDNDQLSVVIINTNASSSVNLDLSFAGFIIEDGNVYQTTSTQNCVLVGTYDGTSALTIPANSITTVALSGTPVPTDCQQVYDYGYILPADLTGDCYVNFKDVELMADYWLTDICPIEIPPPGHSPDIEPDCEVNLLDFATLAAQWFICNDPEDPYCTPPN